MNRRTCPANRTDVPRHGAPPPKLSGCGKLQIVILSGKKNEHSSTHDFALRSSASYKPRQPCLAILIDTRRVPVERDIINVYDVFEI